MPLAPAQSPPAARWPARVVKDALQANGLLGHYDGGTWSRAVSRFISAPDVTTFIAKLEALELDETQVLELLADEYIQPGSPHGRVDRGGDGSFIAREPWSASAAATQHAVRELAASYGVTQVAIDSPHDLAAIHRALGMAFARSGRPERVYMVGRRNPFIMIRTQLIPAGPFAASVPYEPLTAPRDDLAER